MDLQGRIADGNYKQCWLVLAFGVADLKLVFVPPGAVVSGLSNPAVGLLV